MYKHVTDHTDVMMTLKQRVKERWHKTVHKGSMYISDSAMSVDCILVMKLHILTAAARSVLYMK